MLSEKPWRTDAILRLVGSVAICVFMGTLAVAMADFLAGRHGTSTGPVLAAAAGACVFFFGTLFFLGRNWRPENATGNLIGAVLCFYPAFLLMWLAIHFIGPGSAGGSSSRDLVLSVLGFQGAALVLMYRFVREHRMRWTEAFGFHVRPVRAVWFGLVAAIPTFAVVYLLQAGTIWALQHFRITPEEQIAVRIVRQATGWWQQGLLGIVTVVIVPPAEEALFRGILYPYIKRLGYPRLALIGTALLFGVVHLNFVTFVPLVMLAMALVWIYEKTGNLLACITTHAGFNAFGFVMLLQERAVDLPHH